MSFKMPHELRVGDEFLEPDSDERAHGGDDRPVKHFRVVAIDDALVWGARIHARDLSTQEDHDMTLMPWVKVEVTKGA